MQFSNDAEETFSRAIKLLVVSDYWCCNLPIHYLLRLSLYVIKMYTYVHAQAKDLLKEGQFVTLVQSGAQPIWRKESSHHIQVRKVEG